MGFRNNTEPYKGYAKPTARVQDTANIPNATEILMLKPGDLNDFLAGASPLDTPGSGGSGVVVL